MHDASRTAISRRRAAARASSMPAMLVPPMTSTRPVSTKRNVAEETHHAAQVAREKRQRQHANTFSLVGLRVRLQLLSEIVARSAWA